MNESISASAERTGLVSVIKIKFVDVITVGFCGYMFFGSTGSEYLYISLALFVFWFASALISSREFVTRIVKDKKYIFFLVADVYAFVSGLSVGGLVFSLKKLVATALLFSPILIYCFYKSTEEKRRIRFVLFCLILCWVISSVQAILFYSAHANSAKTLAADARAYGDIAIGGGMLLAYATALFASILTDMFFQKKKRFWSVCLLILSLYLLVKTESTITLICGIIGIGVSIIGKPEKNQSWKIIKIAVVTLLMVWLLVNLRTVGNGIINLGASIGGVFGDRVKSFGYALYGDTANGSYAFERLTKISESFMTFLRNPITGVCYLHGNGFIRPEQVGVGNHSAWMDAFANYGILFGSIFILPYALQMKDLLKNSSGIFTYGWIVCFVLMGLLNPIEGFQPNLFLFLIIPLMNQLFIIEKKEMEEQEGGKKNTEENDEGTRAAQVNTL